MMLCNLLLTQLIFNLIHNFAKDFSKALNSNTFKVAFILNLKLFFND